MQILEKETPEQFLVRLGSNSRRSSRNGVCWVFSSRAVVDRQILIPNYCNVGMFVDLK